MKVNEEEPIFDFVCNFGVAYYCHGKWERISTVDAVLGKNQSIKSVERNNKKITER